MTDKKTILITGSTDGIGFLTAKKLIQEGHDVLIHGRDKQKLQDVKTELSKYQTSGSIDSFLADLSIINEVKKFSNDIKKKYQKIDVLINNAGIYKTPQTITKDNIDIRFAVNTISPYLLTKELLPLSTAEARVVNLSSAAQAPVDLKNITNFSSLDDSLAYAQSKLAITMWSFYLAKQLKDKNISVIAVNPKSLLASKMVKEAYGINGANLNIGADILYKASLSDEFKNASGKYYDNDIASFAQHHHDALNDNKCKEVVNKIEEFLEKVQG